MARKFDDSLLVVATHNKGKLAEIRDLLGPLGVNIRSAAEFGLTEPKETEDSFVGNARIKAHHAASLTGFPALADDSGIAIDALNGAPGVYTADWAETPNGRDFLVAMTRSWKAARDTSAKEPYAAQFRCTLVLAWPDGHDEVFDGSVSGTLVWPIRGALGHGYDPMFLPDGFDITFAEMSSEQKNRISHRSVAFAKLVGHCFT